MPSSAKLRSIEIVEDQTAESRCDDGFLSLTRLRLADHLGYVTQLDCFVDELPESLQKRYRSLGIAAAPGAAGRARRCLTREALDS